MSNRTINLYDGLEALYYFDTDYWDGGANEISDQSGHGRHVWATGGPTIGVEGPNDFGATSFDAVDDHFSAGDPLGFSPMAVSVLLRIENFANDNKKNVVSNYDAAAEDGFLMEANGFGAMRFSIYGSNGVASIYDSGATGDKWLLYTGFYDGEEMGLFRDTTLVDRQSASHTPAATNSLLIGENSATNSRYFDGELAFLWRWSRVPSYTEIQYLNNLTAPVRSI